MEKKPLDTKTVRNYWCEVIRRAYKPVWDEITMRVVIIGIVLLLLVAFISGLLLFFGIISTGFYMDRAREAQAGMDASILSAAIFLVLFLLQIYRVPAEMHDELGGFIENPFQLEARPPLPKYESEPRWASITVVNISPFKIEGCFLTLDDIYDSTGKSVLLSRQRRLLWSSGEGKTRDKELDVLPNEPRIVDVATTSPHNIEVTFTTWAGDQSEPRGIYDVVITAHGQWKGTYVPNKKFFTIEYSGRNILTIREKGRENWQDTNPKKPKSPRFYRGEPSS